jgi:cell division protein FtsB
MTGVRSPLALMRRAALPALGLLIIVNFLGYAVVGDNGVLSWGDYRRQKAERAVQLAELQAERARLAHRARLLDPRNADPDLAEELVRTEFGYVRPDEVIIPLDGRAAPAAASAPAAAPVAAPRH